MNEDIEQLATLKNFTDNPLFEYLNKYRQNERIRQVDYLEGETGV